jgi:site-specific recombinase XerD
MKRRERWRRAVRTAPTYPQLRVLLRYLPFTFSQSWLQKLIRKAMNAADFKHLTLDDLRHSTASAMIDNGVDLHTVGAVLGHKDSRSTARYSHRAASTLNAAIRKVR